MKDKISIDRLKLLHPKARAPFQAFIEEAESHDDCTYRISQGLRTIAQQNDIYASGRTKKGPILTNAKGGQSFHNYGLAIDLVKLVTTTTGGKPVTKADWEADYSHLQVLANKYGITWGGIFRDYDHFEMEFGHGTHGWQYFLNLYNTGKVDKQGYVIF